MLLQVRHSFTSNAQAETWTIFRQDYAIAIIDPAAAGGDRLNVHAVVFRQGGVVLKLGDLQVIKASDQNRRQQQYYCSRQHHTALHYPGVIGGVFKMDRSGHESLVVGMTVENSPGSVQLFGQQYPYQWMR